MNYLGHALLSLGDAQLLTGNMLGDFIKGRKALEAFPDRIRQGILLHRKIDQFTDEHPASLKAKNYFRADYRLYAGAFVDSLYDHFLANDPYYFPSSEALLQFTQDTYAQLQEYRAYIPESVRPFMDRMRSDNWLYGYRTLKGMERAFQGLVYRAAYLEHSERAYEILVTHFYEFNQLYYDFIGDLFSFVKNELNEWPAQH